MAGSHVAVMVQDGVQPVGGIGRVLRAPTESPQWQFMAKVDDPIVPHEITPSALESLQMQDQNAGHRFEEETPVGVLELALRTGPLQLATRQVRFHRLGQQILQQKRNILSR